MVFTYNDSNIDESKGKIRKAVGKSTALKCWKINLKSRVCDSDSLNLTLLINSNNLVVLIDIWKYSCGKND